jgi:hypothetical protein
MSSSAGATISSDVTANIRNTLARSESPLIRVPLGGSCSPESVH